LTVTVVQRIARPDLELQGYEIAVQVAKNPAAAAKLADKRDIHPQMRAHGMQGFDEHLAQ